MEWRLLQGLSDHDRERVLATARTRSYARGDVVFREGEPGDTLHLVASGSAGIRITTPDGDVATLTVVGPGDAFGELALLRRSSTRTASAVALEPLTTLALHRDAFETLCAEHPHVNRLLVGVLAARVERLTTHLVEALHVPAEKRVLRRLLEVCRLYAGGDAATVVVPLTQEDLSGLAGTTRPTVNLVLRRMQDEGVVALSRGRIDVVDVAALRRAAR